MTESKVEFTVIVPVTEAVAYLLAATLDSIEAQGKSQVVVIDGTKRGVVLAPKEGRSVYRAVGSNRFAMMNQGLLYAEGEYVHFLQPGEFYLSPHAFERMRQFIDAQGEPDVAYSGYLIRKNRGQPKVCLKPLSLKCLQKMHVAPTLQAYWFRRETLQMVGKLSEKFKIQGGLEILCRLYCARTLRKAFMNRVLTDYEYRKPSSRWVVRHFFETFGILVFYFGFTGGLFSWVGQNYMKVVRWGWKRFKMAFWKEHETMV